MQDTVFDVFWLPEHRHFHKYGEISPFLNKIRQAILREDPSGAKILEYETNDIELLINKENNTVCATHIYRDVNPTECIPIARFLERIEKTGSEPVHQVTKRRKGLQFLRFLLFRKG